MYGLIYAYGAEQPQLIYNDLLTTLPLAKVYIFSLPLENASPLQDRPGFVGTVDMIRNFSFVMMPHL